MSRAGRVTFFVLAVMLAGVLAVVHERGGRPETSAPTAPAPAPKSATHVMQSLGPTLLECRTARRDTTCHYSGWDSTFCAAAREAVTADGIFEEIRAFNGGAQVDEIELLLKVNAAIQRCKS